MRKPGCASGIGLATTRLLLKLGAFVVGSDIQSAAIDDPNFTFVSADVTDWNALSSLFKAAITKHEHVDHVYANAGIGGRANYLEDHFDDKGELLEPNHLVFDVNLRAVVNTAYLGLHYLKKNSRGGSIVLIASASAFQRFRVVDYAAAKHGVLGLMRGLYPAIETAGLPIRINTVAPSWTLTGLVPDVISTAGKKTQGPDMVARKVAVLMADGGRNGQLIYSHAGKFKEIEESLLLKVVDDILDGDIGDDIVVKRMIDMYQAQKGESKT